MRSAGLVVAAVVVVLTATSTWSDEGERHPDAVRAPTVRTVIPTSVTSPRPRPLRPGTTPRSGGCSRRPVALGLGSSTFSDGTGCLTVCTVTVSAGTPPAGVSTAEPCHGPVTSKLVPIRRR